MAVFDSNDFTFEDKVRVLEAIKKRINVLKQPFLADDADTAPAARSAPAPSINEMIQREQTFLPKSDNGPQTEEDLLTMF